MLRVGQGARRTAGWLLAVLFGLGLACLALPGTAAGGLTTAWIRSYNGLTGSGAGRRIALDSQGNVFIAGSGYTIIKYNPDGEEMWVRTYRGPDTGDGYANALLVDGQGNVYITGGMQVSHGEYGNRDYVTVKYSNDGRQLWVRRYNGPANGEDNARALAVDGQGNVLVTGDSYGGDSRRDCLTIKYNADGRLLWARRYNQQGGGDSYAVAIAVDGQGNAYVAGAGYSVIKYSPDGRPFWVRHYNGKDNKGGHAIGLAVDSQGNICVTGSSYMGQYWRGYTTIKYSADGRRLWVRQCQVPSPYPAGEAQAIAVDGQDNILVTGNSWNPYGPSYGFYATVKYRADGQRLWMRIFEPHLPLPYQTDDTILADTIETGGAELYSYSFYLNSIALDTQGNVYLANGGFLKYRADGRWLWLQYLNGLDGIIPLTSVAVDSEGNVYGVGGNLTVKYTQTP